jgi:ABC-type sugar transport system permease subunit
VPARIDDAQSSARLRLAPLYKVIVFIPVVLAPAIMAPVFRHMFAPDGELNAVLQRSTTSTRRAHRGGAC